MAKHKSHRPDTDSPYILITIHPDSGTHDDLTFRFGENEFTTDSYFYLIDPEYERRWPDVSSGQDFLQNALADVLTQWRSHVETLMSGNMIYLPFGLYDECTLVLRCRRERELLAITPGWSELGCTAFLPSDVSPALRHKHHHFAPTSEERTTTRLKFLADITSAIERLSA